MLSTSFQRLLLLCGAFSLFNTLKAQTSFADSVFSHLHAIQEKDLLLLEAEGYNVFVKVHAASFDNAGFNQIKRAYDINLSAPVQRDTAFFSAKLLSKTEDVSSTITASSIYYLFPSGFNQIKVIGLQTFGLRNKELEKLLVRSLVNQSIPQSAFTSRTADSILFAGRRIQLGNVCKWMRPHNVQCPDLGQMNWTSCSNYEKAQTVLHAQYLITAGKAIGDIIEKDSVAVIFEGQAVKALKTHYKIRIPSLIMGGSNMLIIYYVLAEVRGQYVACVLSHYTDNAAPGQLPPLLAEVMQLQE